MTKGRWGQPRAWQGACHHIFAGLRWSHGPVSHSASVVV